MPSIVECCVRACRLLRALDQLEGRQAAPHVGQYPKNVNIVALPNGHVLAAEISRFVNALAAAYDRITYRG